MRSLQPGRFVCVSLPQGPVPPPVQVFLIPASRVFHAKVAATRRSFAAVLLLHTSPPTPVCAAIQHKCPTSFADDERENTTALQHARRHSVGRLGMWCAVNTRSHTLPWLTRKGEDHDHTGKSSKDPNRSRRITVPSARSGCRGERQCTQGENHNHRRGHHNGRRAGGTLYMVCAFACASPDRTWCLS